MILKPHPIGAPVVALSGALAWTAGSLAAADGRVGVQVVMAPGDTAPAAPIPAELRATRQAALPGDGDEVLVRQVEVPGGLDLDLAPESTWSLTVIAAGYWAPEIVLAPGARPPVRFSLLPAGRIGGRLAAGRQEVTPAAVDVRFQAAPGARFPVPPATTSCPVRELRWECEVPAGRLDLRLLAGGFVPLYAWDVEVRPRETAVLGTFALVRGASLVGRVEVDGPAGGDAPEVELLPSRMAPPGSPAAAQRADQRSFHARANARGFFQLAGLPAGEYRALGRLAGFAPARSLPVAVAPGAETELKDPLVLHRPLALEVRLDPPLDPYGQPWQMLLLAADSLAPPRGVQPLPVGEGPADAAGLWRQEGLASGSYLLHVGDLGGSLWRAEAMELTPATSPLDLDLGLVIVEGRIWAGDEPVEATLWLGRSRPVQRIRLDSDGEGELSGALPGEGEWSVDMELPGEGVQALAPVEVRRLPGSRRARLDIRVPDTRLAVRVTDERDAAVAGAEVIVLGAPETRRREAQATTMKRGRSSCAASCPAPSGCTREARTCRASGSPTSSPRGRGRPRCASSCAGRSTCPAGSSPRRARLPAPS